MTGPAAVCSACGKVVDGADPMFTWATENVAGPDGRATTRRTCESCTRRHVRSIEAKLDPLWW